MDEKKLLRGISNYLNAKMGIKYSNTDLRHILVDYIQLLREVYAKFPNIDNNTNILSLLEYTLEQKDESSYEVTFYFGEYPIANLVINGEPDILIAILDEIDSFMIENNLRDYFMQ